MKKFLCVALSSLLCVSALALAACGEEEQPPAPSEETPPESTAVVYPSDPIFSSLAEDRSTKAQYKAHDPVIVEAKDEFGSIFYAFSTDNDGGYGVQVRKSYNAAIWEQLDPAIEGYTAKMSDDSVKQMFRSASTSFHLYDVYRWISRGADWGNGCWTLWAPDVVPAAGNTSLAVDGGWWMYSCWTTGFGSMRSVIFKLNAENIEGPYTFDKVIVRDADETGKGGGINEIDPSIYYSADGSRMFMSYGSFGVGFGVIELDPATGLRKNANEADTVAGKKMVTASGFDAEGSSVAYYERDVYTGDIANEPYDETKWEKQGKYIMMASDGALSYNYVMRTWESDTPDGPFTSSRGGAGFQVAGNWT